jgi:hypothetical protein
MSLMRHNHKLIRRKTGKSATAAINEAGEECLLRRNHQRRLGVATQDDDETVVRFSRAQRDANSGNSDQLDRAGQTVLQLLGKAAGVVEENSRHAIETAQRLSHQLRGAENRVGELEAEVTAYREQADRAEQWLHRVYSEIEERFLHQDRNAQRAQRR